MSLIFATQLSAVATVTLAVFAVVTGVFAFLAFRKQSEEVRAIEQQVKDAQELTRQQAELLKVQSGQLELQRHQVNDQLQANARQADVLELQATELRESLEQRKRDAEEQRRAQASRVFISQRESTLFLPTGQMGVPALTATVVNSSDQPIYDAELYWRRGSAGYGDPNPEILSTVMPGAEIAKGRSFPRGTSLDVSGAVLSFRDAGGISWTRRPDGGLVEREA
jgi:aconitase A